MLFSISYNTPQYPVRIALITSRHKANVMRPTAHVLQPTMQRPEVQLMVSSKSQRRAGSCWADVALAESTLKM